MAETLKERPVYRNIHVAQIVRYRLPPAGIVSILHRISGMLLFVLLPLAIWLFDLSVTSEISYDRFRNVFIAGAFGLPAWFIKLVVLGMIWGYLFHAMAGLRHLWMDATHSVALRQGRVSAQAVLLLSTVLTLLLGARLFGLY